jgi:hypothetical protein
MSFAIGAKPKSYKSKKAGKGKVAGGKKPKSAKKSAKKSTKKSAKKSAKKSKKSAKKH